MANTQTTVPTFIPGQVLEASQLVNSAATGVPVFATTVTRDAGFGGAGEKALAEGQLCYLESTNVVQYYDGAAWATLGPAPAVSSGLTFISKTTISATTQSNLTNVFSTAYDHYSVRFTDLVGSTDINLRYGTSGTPDTASTYMNTGIYVDSSSVAQQAYAFNAGKSILSNSAGANGSSLFLEISSPFLAKITTYSAVTSSILTGQMVSNCFAGLKNTTTSYTDLVLLSNNNFSCVVSIYGYANS